MNEDNIFKNVIAIVFAGAIFIISFAVTYNLLNSDDVHVEKSNDSHIEKTSNSYDEKFAWDAGEGFEKIRTTRNDIVAYKYLKKGRVEVKTLHGCESLFVSANAYINNVIVDSDIEYARYVGPNESAIFEINFRKGERWRITDISCY